MPKFITVFPSPNTQRKLHGKKVNARGTRRWAKTSMRSEVSWFAWSAASECVREPEHVRSGAGGTKHRVWRVCYETSTTLRSRCVLHCAVVLGSMCSAACSIICCEGLQGRRRLSWFAVLPFPALMFVVPGSGHTADGAASHGSLE